MASSFTRVRRRIYPSEKSGVHKLGYFNPAVTSNGQFVRWHEAQINAQHYNFQSSTYSKAQITEDNIHGGPPFKSGGPFRTLTLEPSTPYFGVHAAGTYVDSAGTMRYVGGFGPPSTSDWRDTSGLYDLNVALVTASPRHASMDGLGDKGYARAKPRLEQASALVFAREGGEIPRMLRTTSKGFHEAWRALLGGGIFTRRSIEDEVRSGRVIKLMKPKKLADQFLNQQFGWSPFLSDLRRFDNVINNSAKIIADLKARNGKWTRKRVSLGDESTIQLLASGTGVSLSPGAALGAQYFSSPPTWSLYETYESHAYAVGKFYYYNPAFDDVDPGSNLALWNHAMQGVILAGARPSPSNIYKSIPWSWAIDWMTNIGLHVDYYSDMLVDSVACQYLYVMKTATRKRRYVQHLPFHAGSIDLVFERRIVSKQRQEGVGPYGFSLTWDQLTPRQLAIAGALGISRK